VVEKDTLQPQDFLGVVPGMVLVQMINLMYVQQNLPNNRRIDPVSTSECKGGRLLSILVN
jgi:hypothetical protein